MTDMIDWTELYQTYKGEWVALDDDEVTVISHGKNAQKVWDEAKQKGFPLPILMPIPKEVLPSVGML